MTSQAAMEAISFAAHQSDRWLFVALLVIGMAAVWFLFRYFTGRIDRLQARMDEQTEDFVAHLKKANAEMLEVIASAKAVIERVERHFQK